MSPSCIELVKSKPLPINFNLVGTASASALGYPSSRQPGIASGDIVVGQTSGGWN